METEKQPAALEIAGLLERWTKNLGMHPSDLVPRAAAELRRLHACEVELKALLESAGAGVVRHNDYTETQMREAIAAAVAKEREACASACSSQYYQYIGVEFGEVRAGIAYCEKAIRARTNQQSKEAI